MFSKLFGSKSEDKYTVTVTFNGFKGLRIPTSFEKPYVYCVFSLENPLRKYLNELGSTTELECKDVGVWENESYDLKAKHLRDLWVKVIALDRSKTIPPLKSLGDLRVDLKNIATEPIHKLWYDLDNQPTSLIYAPPEVTKPRSGSKPPPPTAFNDLDGHEDLQVGQNEVLPDGQLCISVKLRSNEFNLKPLTRSGSSDYDLKDSLL